jgi:hypothetical protein
MRSFEITIRFSNPSDSHFNNDCVAVFRRRYAGHTVIRLYFNSPLEDRELEDEAESIFNSVLPELELYDLDRALGVCKA